jgi:sulfide:quinone oxidoreductase
MPQHRPLDVIIAGAGPAAIEAALALSRIAGGRVRTTILTPDAAHLHLPMTVLSPFAACGSARRPLATLASIAGADIRSGTLGSVDVTGRTLYTGEGQALRYDALLVAVGGQRRSPYPRALAFGPRGSDERMHGLIQDLEGGYVRRVAFVVAPGVSWPLPLYELALMTAERAYGMCLDVELTLVTPECAPLDVFGSAAAREIARLLDQAGIRVLTRALAGVPSPSAVALQPSAGRLDVQRVVTLPALSGPALEGLPHDADGFLPVDRHGRVAGAPDVYAAGDAVNFEIKLGGLACLQADAAAETIAATAGAAIDPTPFAPFLRAALVTEYDCRWLQRDLSDEHDEGSITRDPPWSPPTKLPARELAPYVPQVRLPRRT